MCLSGGAELIHLILNVSGFANLVLVDKVRHGSECDLGMLAVRCVAAVRNADSLHRSAGLLPDGFHLAPGSIRVRFSLDDEHGYLICGSSASMSQARNSGCSQTSFHPRKAMSVLDPWWCINFGGI
jgi:hypothetical protein